MRARRTAAMPRRRRPRAALAAGTTEEVDRYSKRTVRMSTQHKEDCKELLQLMGVPVVEAPCEAEAQCAALARDGKVWAVASEDMDALTFRAPILVRCARLPRHVWTRPLPPLTFSPPPSCAGSRSRRRARCLYSRSTTTRPWKASG